MRCGATIGVLVVGLVAAGPLWVIGCGEEFQASPPNASPGGGAATGGGGEGAAATGGGTATGGGGATTGGGGQGGGPPEICTDGVDNDGDQAIDCADADCTDRGFHCVPAPSDWDGPVVLLGPSGSDECPDGWDPDAAWSAGATVRVPAEPCGPCDECADPPYSNDASCTSTVRLHSLATCNYPYATKQVGPDCTPTAASIQSFTPMPPVAAGAGLCAASQGPAPGDCVLDELYHRCTRSQYEAAGCSDGQLCMPPVTAPALVCVHQSGELQCPGGEDGPTPLVLYGEVENTRTCSCACTLGCTATVDVWGGSVDCMVTNPSMSVPAEGQCIGTAGGSYSSPSFMLAGVGYFCERGDPTLSGGCEPATTETYCCW